MLTILGVSRRSKWGSYYRCRCACGTEKDVRGDHLRNGKIVSCGCYIREKTRKRATKHGLTSEFRDPRTRKAYVAWANIIKRCTNPQHPEYPNYGGRGISVCERWQGESGAQNFIADMGIPEPGLSIDRINNNGNYEPGNCRWATTIQQARNNRRNVVLTHNGETMTMAAWSEKTGICQRTIRARLLEYGWPVGRVLTEPVNEKCRTSFCKAKRA